MSIRSDSDRAPSRYVVGIDLGTTNCAMAYVDTERPGAKVETFPIPQLVGVGQIEARETLPSFHYQAASGEFSTGALALPWGERDPQEVVGFLARDHGESIPGRLISSAKSWLCHARVDRTAELLPWHAAADAARLSPIEASARYLAHLRGAWDHRFPEHALATQEVILTLPASFDEVARELTVKAGARAGLSRVVLVEEPQAAFYAWIDSQGSDWERAVRPGQKILVCDVGGGTTDFTLIRVRGSATRQVQFHRVAVGEHLILGGDNLDLALAHHLERRLVGDGKLAPRAWSVLVQSCRRAKEVLLGENPPEVMVLNVPGVGSRLIGGATRIEVTRQEVQEVLVDGFLPSVAIDARPATHRSGFQEFGLPYAPDAAITRHLAAFLWTHRHVSLPEDRQPASDLLAARPDVVLLNGGLFESPLLRARLLEVLCSWFPKQESGSAWRPLLLENQRLDLAVARGAAYYGMVRRGVGVRISAGLARTYYIGVESRDAQAMAVCLVPAGTEEGTQVDLSQHTFQLLVRQPVEFPLYVSSTRLTDTAGAIVAVDRDQMSSLPPIRTVLQEGKKSAGAQELSVRLHARLSEIGTLDVWCSDSASQRQWRLVFDVRSATQTDLEGHEGVAESAGVVDEATRNACQAAIREAYQPQAPSRGNPEGLVKTLEQVIGTARSEWPPSLLRGMWEVLMEVQASRGKSSAHEARWLYLLGYSLRPGCGLALDDWRVAQTWRLFQGKRLLNAAVACRVEWLILWRRIASGLAAGQQRSLADPLLACVRTAGSGRSRPGASGKSSGTVGSHELAETWRLLGSLELLPASTKLELGNLLLTRLPRETAFAMAEALVWTLGRLGTRVPLHGSLNAVVATEVVEHWLVELMRVNPTSPTLLFSAVQMARRTHDRYRDISDKVRDQVLAWLDRQNTREHYLQLVRQGGDLASDEQGMMFGESLPRGLRLG